MLRLICLALISSLLTLGTFSSTLGQEVKKDPANKTQIVTASVTTDGVRISAPSSLAQLRLEIYDFAGQKLVDTEQRGGNVIDWHLQGNAGERVADGTYLLVVSIRNPGGQLSQKLGLVTVSAQSTTLRPAGIAELSQRQAQVVGPIEGEDEGLTVMPAEDAQPVTVLAHTGDEAQVTRSRGAVTFRFGDFFGGRDKEQMRLTEEGNLGIGTAKPKVKLDVAGMIRAREGFLFSNGSALNVNDKGALTLTSSDGSVTPNLAGTGTQNKITKWSDNAGTLGDSVVTEANGNIGIGTASPQAALHVMGNQFLKPLGAIPTYEVLAGSDPTSTVMLTTDSSAFGWQIAPSNAPSDTLVQVLGQNFASVANRGEFGVYLGANSASAFKVIQRGGPELMRVNRTGNVGIGTTNPSQKLEVAGNIKLSGTGSSLMFPDGTSMTTAGGGGTPSGTNIVSAVNDPATSGVIGDARLSPNVARLNSANTFTGNQGVNGDVSVNGTLNASALNLNGSQSFPGWITGGALQVNTANISNLNADAGTMQVQAWNHRVGVKTADPQYDLHVAGSFGASSVNTGSVQFSDGSTQTIAAPISKMYTTSPTGADIEIGPRGSSGLPTLTPVLQLILPSGSNGHTVTYLVTATVQFENTANLVFQNNTRSVTCKIGNESWSFRLGSPGSPMDQLPITLHTMVGLQGFASTPTDKPVTLSCGASDGGTDRSFVFAKARRFTATRLESFTTQ